MSQILERIFVLLVVFQCTHQQSNTEVYNEKEIVSLNCDPPSKGSVINWFRVREDSIEFLASFTVTGDVKTNSDPSVFSAEKISRNILTLKGFQKARDSGVYSCASFNKNMLHFGKATRIQGKPEARPTVKAVAAVTAARPKPSDSAYSPAPCSCPTPRDTQLLHPSINCDLVIFAPLAGVCGLLVLILILTICCCNRMRTKRCPHHYKRTPKNPAPVRQATLDRYV